MTANEILKIALGEVGTKESPANSNRTKYGEAYGLDGYPWCLMFVWWCFDKADASKLFHNGGKCASCNQYISWAKGAGQWITSGYKPGDIVFMCFNGSGTASHVGIVYGVTSSGLVTIEGNTSASGSQDNGGMVLQKARPIKYIVGAARPAYEERFAVNKRNDYIRDYCGVTIWHEAGYTGKRVRIASAEDFINSGVNSHDYQSYLAAREFAPDGQCCYIYHDSEADLEKLKGVSVYWGSVTPGYNGIGSMLDAALNGYPDVCAMFAAGNTATKPSPYIKGANIWGVGAVTVTGNPMVNGVPASGAEIIVAPQDYSGESRYVDFAAPTNIYTATNDRFTGTSCATAVLGGICAVINDYFIDKTSRPLSRAMMYQFLKDCAMDIEIAGKDDKTGYGLPILPPPDAVDITKYTEDEMRYQTINDVPEWGKATVDKLIANGSLKGGDTGLDLSADMLRMFVILDRQGLIK